MIIFRKLEEKDSEQIAKLEKEIFKNARQRRELKKHGESLILLCLWQKKRNKL